MFDPPPPCVNRLRLSVTAHAVDVRHGHPGNS